MKITTLARTFSIAAVAAITSIASLAPLNAAHADPPSWAPAHGYRAHHGDEGDNNDRHGDKGDRKQHKRNDDAEDRDGNGNRDNSGYRNSNGDGNRDNSGYRNGSGNRNYSHGSYSAPSVGDANRQSTKNNWRNLGIASVAVAAYGLLKHDPTITFAGAAGALYSANRYEQDRKSQSSTDQARAAFFDRGYFERDGVRYTRHEVVQNGQRYFVFRR
jgi:hypothetical protein